MRFGGKVLALLLALPLLLLAIADSGSTSASSNKAVAGQRPNVVVLYLDDANTSQMMQFLPKTRQWMEPAGTRFDRLYSNNPLCCPFRAIVVSGQHTHNNHVLSNKPQYGGGAARLNENQTLAPYLKKNGYKVGYIGKYMNGYTGPGWVPRGYDEWFVPYQGIYRYNNTTFSWNGRKVVRPGYVTTVYQKRTDKTIRQFSRSGKPWVLYVSHLTPHSRSLNGTWVPPLPAKKYRGTVSEASLPPLVLEDDVSDKPSWIQERPAISESDVSRINTRRVRSAEAMRSVDDAIDSMFRTLKQTGQLANTIVIITSDNGYMQGNHRMGSEKIVPYEDSARVTAWARGPGIQRGVVNTRVTGSVDIGATILDATGTRVPYPVDGYTLRNPLDDRQMLLEAGAYLMPGVNTGDPSLRSYEAVVDERYKYIVYWDGQRELYDLANDPNELESLIDTDPLLADQYQQVLEQLKDCYGNACNVVQ